MFEALALSEAFCIPLLFRSWIYSSLPANKQMLAVSATYPESLASTLSRYMRDPTFVQLNPTDPSLIGMYAVLTDLSNNEQLS